MKTRTYPVRRASIFTTAAVILTAVSATSMSTPAAAYDFSVDTKVTAVEVSYAPDFVKFYLAQQVGTCPAGSEITWHGRGADATAKAANTNAVLSTLLSAKLTNTAVRAYGTNGTCELDFLWIAP